MLLHLREGEKPSLESQRMKEGKCKYCGEKWDPKPGFAPSLRCSGVYLEVVRIPLGVVFLEVSLNASFKLVLNDLGLTSCLLHGRNIIIILTHIECVVSVHVCMFVVVVHRLVL